MAPRFILVDHSLTSTGGHHMEYAKQVLGAAKQAGYRTLLATHKSCESFRHDAIDEMRPIFDHGIWENNLSEETPSFYHSLKRICVHLANDYPTLAKCLPRSLLLFFFPLVPQALQGKDIFIRRFSQGLKALSLSPEDIIFVPNMGNIELAAISAFPFKLHWHLLFRRNVLEGSEPSYADQLAHPSLALERTWQAFKSAESLHAHFYTDTNELTAQYALISGRAFHTLPIPLGEVKKRVPSSTKILHIAYIGDARNEKGFPLLAPLIADLQRSGEAANVRFTIQSNFNIPGGESDSRRNKAHLKTFPSSLVTIQEGPFASREYHALIESADIILLPYDVQRYYARSSGIFAEGIAAGVPVVTRNKSWMSHSLLEFQQAHLNRLLSTQTPLQTLPVRDADLQFTRKSLNSVIIIRAENDTSLEGHFIEASLDHNDASLIKTASLDLRAPYALACLRLPEQKIINLHFSSGQNCTVFEIEDTHDSQFTAASLFSDNADFSAALHEIIAHYPAYAAQAAGLQEAWRAQHNRHMLVQILEKNQGKTPF